MRLLLFFLSFSLFATDYGLNVNALDSLPDEMDMMGLKIAIDHDQDGQFREGDNYIELFHGELDLNDPDERVINWLKNEYADGHRTNPDFGSEVILFQDNQDHNIDAYQVLAARIANENTIIEDNLVPERFQNPAIRRQFEAFNQGRSPDSFLGIDSTRAFWTAVRINTTGGAIFFTTFLNSGVSHSIGLMASLIPGIGSGLFTFHSDATNRYYSNGEWSRRLINSNIFGTRSNLENYEMQLTAELMEKKDELLRNYPELRETPELFEEINRAIDDEAFRLALVRKNEILRRLNIAERFAKWGMLDQIFMIIGLHLPQMGTGINPIPNMSLTGSGSLGNFAMNSMSLTAEKLITSAPFDMAILERGRQEYIQLEADVRDYHVIVENRDKFLSEIDKVIRGSVSPNSQSHPRIKKIANRVRMKQTFISMLSNAAIGLRSVGVDSVANVISGTLTLTGGVYYSKVFNIFERRSNLNQQFVQQVEELVPTMQAKHCQRLLLPRVNP